MRTFRLFAFLSCIGTYLVIFAGGLVRVSGAGLGCPDWPTCYGRWLPPLNLSQLPPDIDPNLVNLTLSWIEYFNRLLGMTLGILIAITAILALIHYRKIKSVWIPAMLAALLVAFEGWQGGQVVLSELKPLIVSAHMIIALAIALLLIYATMKAYFLEHKQLESQSHYSRGTGLLLILVGLVAGCQVLLGADIRGSIELAAISFPLADNLILLGKLAANRNLHIALGTLIAIGSWIVAYLLLSSGSRPSLLVRNGAWWILILMAAQPIIGFGLIAAGIPPLLQVFHLWTASFFLGNLLLIFLAVRRAREVAI